MNEDTLAILAFPVIQDELALEFITELATGLDSRVVMKSLGQSAPLLAISFTPTSQEQIDTVFEIFKSMGYPFNIRFQSNSELLKVTVFRVGMQDPITFSATEASVNDRHTRLEHSIDIECSYEGIVMASVETIGPTANLKLVH